MRKNVYFVVALVAIVFILGCGEGNQIYAEPTSSQSVSFLTTVANEKKPKLHKIEIQGEIFLADEQGELRYLMEGPMVYIDLDREEFIFGSRYSSYAPGTTYYGAVYDGYKVLCDVGAVSGLKSSNFDFGPEGGKLPVSNEFSQCSFYAFVVDGEGVVFTSKPTNIYYLKK